MSSSPLRIAPRVRAALADGEPVVALESALLTHGLPRPQNLETARRLERAVREEGAVPATIGVLAGALVVGLDDDGLERLGGDAAAAKVSRRDLGPVIAAGGAGGTTVAGTLVAARLAGIRWLATGGIGGVHRGAAESFDLSADLAELARSPVGVVCSGAKSILDLAKTLELLETVGVPVVGYGVDEMPAFLARSCGLPVAHRVDDPAAAARLARAHWSLGLDSAVLLVQPPPASAALDADLVGRWLEEALAETATAPTGGALTPTLLRRLAAASGGRTVAANLALLDANARLAARVAVAAG